MGESIVKLDEIGFWSEIKLDILKEYSTAYSIILSAQKSKIALDHFYIDAFAGAGSHISKNRREIIPGSPANALLVSPPFKGYYFIDMNQLKIVLLEELAEGRRDVEIFSGDCNKILIENIFPNVRFEQYRRALCILDPYGLDLKWEIMRDAGQMKSVEIFLNFPIMDMNMNALKHDKENVDPRQKARMSSFWGDNSWEQYAYKPDMFGFPLKATNDDVVAAFRKRLREVAGFKFVPEPLAMKNTSNAVVYYLFFASPNERGSKIAQSIFSKYRKRM